MAGAEFEEEVELPLLEVATGVRLLTLLLGAGITTGSCLPPCGISTRVVDLGLTAGATTDLGGEGTELVCKGVDCCLGAGAGTLTILFVSAPMCLVGVSCAIKAKLATTMAVTVNVIGRSKEGRECSFRVCPCFLLDMITVTILPDKSLGHTCLANLFRLNSPC